METLTIQIPDKDAGVIKEVLKRFNVKIVKATKAGFAEYIPNELTKKTIEDAHKGMSLGQPIKDIKSFVTSA
ncbi:hypothetical protein FW774_17485 [Pedobacter sp. BS3]|uniref:hypothetical protein n=1 Tax=Pedobacter sp. BS3 TaxID=2567937 RepID=UPI0011EC401D|nr:hypothetical protein [Pedobacter sp. BS3]TZF81846.1 hypothetical protein FW774_17485 [Pedobacter sp. BS3]